MKKQRTDWTDHVLAIILVLVLWLSVMTIMEVAKAHHDEKEPPTTPEVWTGPPIPQCDKELWLRIKDGCQEKEQQQPNPKDDPEDKFWCERSNGTYKNGECSLGNDY